MSVTLQANIKSSGIGKKPCSDCNGTLAYGPSWPKLLGRPCACIDYATPEIPAGWEYDPDSDGPTLNVANVNWTIMAEAVGLQAEPCGEVAYELLPVLAEQLTSLSTTVLAETQDFKSAALGGRVICQSASDEAWEQRIDRARLVVEFAIASGVSVVWS